MKISFVPERWVLAMLSSLVPVAGNSETGPNQPAAARKIEEIVVVAHPLSGEGLSQASTVLVGAELERKLATSIGATLANEPGIHSAQFGNAVGRPVIHGLGGPRVRVMEDRIDVLDLSVTSADHSVAVEPFIAERVEVLKGSSALLYGSGAIGGVVDVHTARIPHELPERRITGGVESRFDSNSHGNVSAAKLNGGWGKIAWHLDGTRKDGDDYEIPGFAESSPLRVLEGEDRADSVRGELPGSHFKAKSYAGGAAFVAPWGFVGAAVSELDADYGLPGGHAEHAEEEGEEAGDDHGGTESLATPALALEQTRVDFELGVKNPFAAFNSLNLRLGVNDYAHQEIEPDGEVATRFSNKAWELRAELVYDWAHGDGALGLQHTDREFSAVGEEAFVPPVSSEETGVFWVFERDFNQFTLEAGLRLGRVKHQAQGGVSEDFATYAASAGLVVELTEHWGLGLIVDYASRAPVAEELYSNGPHLVTGSYELGDPDLDSERAINLSATLDYHSDVWELSTTAYYTDFADFIYQQADGNTRLDLPVFQFRQDQAKFYGLDLSATVKVASWEAGHLSLRGQYDEVQARVDATGSDFLPRIPPRRFGLGLLTESGRFTASIDYLRVAAQHKVAEQELKTAGYGDLRAYVGAEFSLGPSSLTLFAAGKNLTDQEQRGHTSFIKDLAPAPGRTLEAGVRVLF